MARAGAEAARRRRAWGLMVDGKRIAHPRDKMDVLEHKTREAWSPMH
jgi:hypothetical protein